jgi:hypothetical protein
LNRSVGQHQLIELHNRDVKRREIPSETGVNPAAPVGSKSDYSAAESSACWYRDPVLHIDRIKQPAFQWLATLHGDVLQQLNRQWSPGGNLDRYRLAMQRIRQ